jgi:hypothetical protein
MSKYLVLLTLITSVSCLADVKSLGQIKIKDTIVTRVRGSGGIYADENSNLSTDYRGMTYTNFTVDSESSNDWYYITNDLGSTMLVITCQPRSSARIICNNYFEKISIVPPATDIGGVKQSFIEFDYLNTSTNKYEFLLGNKFVRGYPNSISGELTGVSTNLIVIDNISSDKFLITSTKAE